jgi:hypothetical protein
LGFHTFLHIGQIVKQKTFRNIQFPFLEKEKNLFDHYYACKVYHSCCLKLFLSHSGWSIASKLRASVARCTTVCCSQRSLSGVRNCCKTGKPLWDSPMITWGPAILAAQWFSCARPCAEGWVAVARCQSYMVSPVPNISRRSMNYTTTPTCTILQCVTPVVLP